jgi:hypothetical protein
VRRCLLCPTGRGRAEPGAVAVGRAGAAGAMLAIEAIEARRDETRRDEAGSDVDCTPPHAWPRERSGWRHRRKAGGPLTASVRRLQSVQPVGDHAAELSSAPERCQARAGQLHGRVALLRNLTAPEPHSRPHAPCAASGRRPPFQLALRVLLYNTRHVVVRRARTAWE